MAINLHIHPPIRVQTAVTYLMNALATLLMNERGLPAETNLACAGWMCGTLLYRYRLGPRDDIAPGTVVLSEEINEDLRQVFARVTSLARSAPAGPDELEAQVAQEGYPLRKTMLEARLLLEPIWRDLAYRQGLSWEDTMGASVILAGTLAGSARKVLGLNNALNIVCHAMLEAAKTAPPLRDELARNGVAPAQLKAWWPRAPLDQRLRHALGRAKPLSW
jgi:hypothetical protein